MIELGTYIRQKRTEKRLPMEYVAEEIGISYQAYQAYEIGKTRLINPSLEKIIRILDIDPCELVRETMNLEIQNHEPAQVMEVLPEYINSTIKQLKADLRERDELIGALKYRLQNDEKANTRPESKKVG